MRFTSFFFLLLNLLSCAANPASIQPSYVPSDIFEPVPCASLESMMDDEIIRLENLTGEQQFSRNRDIALNVLLIPGLGALTGDREEDIAQAKGRLIAMSGEYNSRCKAGV